MYTHTHTCTHALSNPYILSYTLTVETIASKYEVPDDLLATIGRVASSVASSASQVGVAYSSRKMVDVYSATGTFADW